jgi:hypothetical protein
VKSPDPLIVVEDRFPQQSLIESQPGEDPLALFPSELSSAAGLPSGPRVDGMAPPEFATSAHWAPRPRPKASPRRLLTFACLALVGVVTGFALSPFRDRRGSDIQKPPSSLLDEVAYTPPPPTPEPRSEVTADTARQRPRQPEIAARTAGGDGVRASQQTAARQTASRTSGPSFPSVPARNLSAVPARAAERLQDVPVRANIVLPRIEDSAPPPVTTIPTATTGARIAETAAPRVEPSETIARPVAAPAAAPEVASAPVARTVTSRAAIESVLDRYTLAFNLLDAQRAKAVWPAVNERNLARAFDSLQEQRFDLGECDITMTPPRATASCEGTASYLPKVGNRKMRAEKRRWTFYLQASGQDWSIESVELR